MYQRDVRLHSHLVWTAIEGTLFNCRSFSHSYSVNPQTHRRKGEGRKERAKRREHTDVEAEAPRLDLTVNIRHACHHNNNYATFPHTTINISHSASALAFAIEYTFVISFTHRG